MKVIPTKIPDVLIIEPKVFGDERGFFFESFNKKVFEEATGITADFVQDNHSKSAKGVLRGLHYQIKQPQGKLVRVVSGEVFDVAVDIKKIIRNFWAMGRVSSYLLKININYGCRKDLLMGLLFYPNLQNFYIKQPIIMRPNMSVVLDGMMLN